MTSALVYEICWNGVNDGRDSDLLDRRLRQPEKRAGGALHVPYGTVRAAVGAVLPTERARALTLVELATLTGCRPEAVTSALHALRQSGALVSETTRPQVYWRRP